ncbi:MAG: NrtR DNA-binding winged helix domain-containing protein [bacterium]
MQGVAQGSGSSVERSNAVASRDYAVTASTVVFRVVREELCVGLPRTPFGATMRRTVPFACPDALAFDAGLDAAARVAASYAVPVREIVRIGNAGVRVIPGGTGNAHATMHIVSWAIARPIVGGTGAAQTVEAEEHFVPLGTLPELDGATRSILACAFEAFLDVTLADALTRRLLPRHVLFRKTDGFSGRSPFEKALGTNEEPAGEPEVPLFVGLLPDPFPLSALRELYERLLGAPLDRGNFRRQFHEVIANGPVKALPIFERGVPHRAGQLFTFDRAAWARFAAK